MKLKELIEVLNILLEEQGDSAVLIDILEKDYFCEIEDVCGKYYIGNANDENGHRINRVFILPEEKDY